MEGERIAQKIIEKTDMSDAVERDKMYDTIREKMGFGRTDLSPKRLVQAMDTPPVVSIPQEKHIEKKLLGQEDINNHPRLLCEQVMVSSRQFQK